MRLSNLHRWLLATAGLLIAGACSRMPELAQGPIQLQAGPTIVRFTHPIAVAGPVWETCFEFEQPGDSHHAHAIRVVLVDTSGQRHQLTEFESDRRGESLVAVTGRIAVGESATDASRAEVIAFEAAELSAPVALRLRGLRGGSRAR